MQFNSYLELLEHLSKIAKNYAADEARLFISEQDWDDWMLDFIDDPDEEILTEQDRRAINDVLVDAFERAHEIHFSIRERRNLICE